MAEIVAAVTGSVAGAMAGIAQEFGSRSACILRLHPGPADRSAEAWDRIQVDLCVTQDATVPRALHDAGLFQAHRVIARNRMELVLRPGLKVESNDPLALLADPRWRIGIISSATDPDGAYARAFLDRLVGERPGLGKSLRDRVVGFHDDLPPHPSRRACSPSLAALRENRADMLIAYGTTALWIADTLPGASYLPLPSAYAPRTDVCACVRKDAPEEVVDFLAYLCGDVARQKLAEAGFLMASV